jgi:hypothetical protein
VLVHSLAPAHPAEDGLGVEVLFVVFEELAKKKSDFSHFSELNLRVEGQSVVQRVQGLRSVQALESGVEKTGISQILQSEYLKMAFVLAHLQLFTPLLLFRHLLLLILILLNYFLLLDLLHLLLQLRMNRPLLQSLMQFLAELYDPGMAIGYFLYLGIAVLHLVPGG